VSSQPTSNKKYVSSASTTSWKFVSGAKGSSVIKALQKKVGTTADGMFGKGTAKSVTEIPRRYPGWILWDKLMQSFAEVVEQAVNNWDRLSGKEKDELIAEYIRQTLEDSDKKYWWLTTSK